jgi:metallophosphoesterase (TIGR03767 family)
MRLVTAAALLLALPAAAVAQSTLDQTITGDDPAKGFSFLRAAPGEPYVLREDLVEARPGREGRRRSLVHFAQLTDFQLSDEESPARVEFLDPQPEDGNPFSAAHRPQEAMVAHMTELAVQQVNKFAKGSPVPQGDGTRAPLGFAITTGDSADNQQRNEVQAVVALLDGGPVEVNSGSANAADYAGPCAAVPVETTPRYTGVQDIRDGFSGGTFYDPNDPRGRYQGWPAYPGLLDRAQQPFTATGLAVPSYVTLGNHDGLVQGNQAANGAFSAVATGCIKITAPVPGSLFADTPDKALAALQSGKAVLTAPDPDRAFVGKPEYRRLHAGGRDAHGFAFIDPAEARASNGAASYYAWSPQPGFRFIAMDTVAEGGVVGDSANGNLDDPQFRWIERTLKAARDAGELVVLFGHHPPGSLTARTPDEVPGACRDAATPGCDLDPRSSQPLHNGEDLRALLRQYPNVVALVSGHTHDNRAQPSPGGQFWEIETAAELDFPHQNRLIEVMDNGDGTLSIFGTVLDHAGPVGAPAPGDASGFDTAQLASLARVIGWNDPQASDPSGDRGRGGLGARKDRNVELVLKDPRPELARFRQAVAAQARCRVTRKLTGVSVTPRGRGLRLRATGAERIDVFQHSIGARVLGERRLVRLRRAGTWSGRGARDGVLSVRFTRGREVRRVTLVRRGGRFRVVTGHDRQRPCELLSQVKVERPVFGGRSNRATGIAVRTSAAATIAVEVRRGSRVVRRFRARPVPAGRLVRFRFDAEGRARGEYRVRVTATGPAGLTDAVTAVTRRV